MNLHYKSIVNTLSQERDLIVDKIGVSPRGGNRKVVRKNSSSLDDEELEESDSNESGTVKMVREQIHKLALVDSYQVVDPLEASESAVNDLKFRKQKALAKKLIQEKEKVIESGLKQRLRDIEADQAKKMMDLALNLDPKREIERRFRDMKKVVDESSEALQSARSVSVSQSGGAPSESVNKRKVQFASP